MLSHSETDCLGETGQKRLLWSPLHAKRATCCPITLQVFKQIATLPKYRTKTGEESGKAMGPIRARMKVTQTHIEQQSCPDLPLNGVAIMAEEVAKLQGLFDLFEEHLDAPSTLVQFADT